MKFPPYLKKGDTIGITCPAGYMAAEKAQTCIETLKKWGYKVVVGKTLGSSSTTYFSGTIEERRYEFQEMLNNKNIQAILCGRGGYGAAQIIDELDFDKFKKHPKWVIGFSDITVLHSHIHQNFKFASLHAPMAAAFNDDGFKNEFIKSLHDALIGKKANYKCATHSLNKLGECSGVLVGGNLSLLAHSIGTASDISTKNKILFIEDIGELIYSSDRLLYQLKRSGKLDELAGLIVGEFSDMKDTDRPFGKSIYEAINDLVKNYKYPICYQFPVGHNKENYALKIGATYQFAVGKKLVRLKEI